MGQKFANRAETTLAADLALAGTAAGVASTASFPPLAAGDYFYVTLSDAAETRFEIVKVTALTGSKYTLTRGQDGTAAQAWPAGTAFRLNVVAQQMRDLMAALAGAPDTYSTSETLTTKTWIDGKPVYRKVVDFGALPNNTTKIVPHDIAAIGTIMPGFPIGRVYDGSAWYPIPQPGTAPVHVWMTSTNIIILTNMNRTGETAYVVIEYTKP